MERVICLFIGYVFGLFQTAYFYGKTKGIDIRKYGSGNAGTTNALRVLGTKAGLIVFAGDCLKCIIAVCITRALFSTGHPENIYLLCLYTGAGSIIGHNFPFYMGFKGGKGIAATAGLILSFHPYFIVMGVVLFFGAFLTTHYVSLGSLLVYAGFMRWKSADRWDCSVPCHSHNCMKCMQLLHFSRLWHIGSTDRILSA